MDQQIATSAVSWHTEHLRVGKHHVQMFSASNTPAASQPCLYNSITNLTCDSVLCTTWTPQATSTVRKEISAQEKWIDLFKVGIVQRVMAGKNFAQLDQGAGAKAASEVWTISRSSARRGDGRRNGCLIDPMCQNPPLRRPLHPKVRNVRKCQDEAI